MKVFQNYSPTTLDAADEALAVTVGDCDAIAFQVTGTFSATLSFEGTMDGTNWVAFYMFSAGSPSPITTATAAGIYRTAFAGTYGMEQVRVRVSAYTSGEANVIWQTQRSAK